MSMTRRGQRRKRRNFWKQTKHSYFPSLEAGFAREFEQWLGKVQIRSEGPALKSTEKDLSTFFPRDIVWNSAATEDLARRLRRIVQEALFSPSLVNYYTPARHVAILGAGASFDALGGLGTEKLADEVCKRLTPETLDSLKRDQGLLWALNSKDLEVLLSALRARAWSFWACRQEEAPLEEMWILEILRAYRAVLMSAQVRYYKGRDLDTESFLKHLDRTGNGRWAIISFNQDTVVEVTAERLFKWDRTIGYGMRIAPKKVGKLKGEAIDPPPPRRIIKPHGSVAWVRPESGSPVRKGSPFHVGWSAQLDNAAFLRSRDSKKRRSIMAKIARQNRRHIPIIMAPSFLKDYEDVWIWNSMAKATYELLNAKHITVIGFRLRPDDTVVSHLIGTALLCNQMKGNRTIEIVGTSSESNQPGAMGLTWAPILAALASRGWIVKRTQRTFHDYVDRLKSTR